MTALMAFLTNPAAAPPGSAAAPLGEDLTPRSRIRRRGASGGAVPSSAPQLRYVTRRSTRRGPR